MALREAPPQIGDRASSGHAGGDQVHILDLSGGIDRSRAPNEIPQNALRFVQNAYYPREALQLQTRPGAGAFQVLATAPATDPPGRITAGHVYTKSTTQSYLVFSCLTVAGDDRSMAPPRRRNLAL